MLGNLLSILFDFAGGSFRFMSNKMHIERFPKYSGRSNIKIVQAVMMNNVPKFKTTKIFHI